ncbi:hypothetical protein ABEW05_003274 [Botrytis cinerea]
MECRKHFPTPASNATALDERPQQIIESRCTYQKDEEKETRDSNTLGNYEGMGTDVNEDSKIQDDKHGSLKSREKDL